MKKLYKKKYQLHKTYHMVKRIKTVMAQGKFICQIKLSALKKYQHHEVVSHHLMAASHWRAAPKHEAK